jgi:hypothetical protein
VSYDRHIEFVKTEVDIHPQSGESKGQIMIDAYFYENEVVVWGWGTFDTFKMESDAVDKVRDCLIKQGFTVLYEEANCTCVVCKKPHRAVVTSLNDIYVCDPCENFEKFG